MEHFLEGIAPLRNWCINLNERSNKIQLLAFELTYQSLNGSTSVMEPAKCKTSIYVLMEICLQYTKRLDPSFIKMAVTLQSKAKKNLVW